MEETQIKATEGARRRAEEAGLDLSTVEGTGADGQVTAQDVNKTLSGIEEARQAADEATEKADAEAAKLAEAAADAEAEEKGRQLLRLKLNPALVEEGTTTATVDGRTFPSRQPVTRADFEENLKPAKDTGGRQVLHIERQV